MKDTKASEEFKTKLPFSKKVRIATPYKGEGDLAERIKDSPTFIMYVNESYYLSLIHDIEDIKQQIRIAKNLHKPVILLLDVSLTKQMIIDIERYLTGMDIIKELTFNFKDDTAKKNAVNEIEPIIWGVARRQKKVEVAEMQAVNFRWQ